MEINKACKEQQKQNEKKGRNLFKETLQAQVCRIHSHLNIPASGTLTPRDLKGLLQFSIYN
jgi:hypothetical protein